MTKVIVNKTYKNSDDYEGWDFEALSGDDYQSERATRLYESLESDCEDEELVLAKKGDNWGLFGLSIEGHEYAIEEDIEDVIEKIDFDELAEAMLCYEYNSRIHINKDGSIDILGSQEYLHPDDSKNIIAVLRSCGTSNLDSSYFTENFAKWNEEKETYVEIKTGREIGDLDDVIRECIKDGDMSVFIDDWKEQIRQDFIED
jgi:hypothetical protein